jgi:signal transduction histidine kinase
MSPNSGGTSPSQGPQNLKSQWYSFMSNVWTLLIADDCAEDREIYREYLSSDPNHSYQILEAASAEVGLALCQNKHCDIVLLDFCLPDMNGLEFLEELQQQPLAASLPVIMLTGQGDERIAAQAIKRGAREYLVKQHLQPDLLQWTVRNTIQKSQLQSAIALPLTEQLERAIAALEHQKQLNAFKSHYLAMVSQEYRRPLTAILAAASTLKLHGDKLGRAKQQQFLEMIEDKARAMVRLAEDLLVMEKFELGEAKFTPLPFELLQFVADIVEEQQKIASDRHELIFSISGNTKGFWGDRQLLRQILVNLLAKAIQDSPDGGPVEVRLRGDASYIRFEVKDNGMGLSREEQECLCDLFEGRSSAGMVSGTGLKLAIANACAKLHRGEMTLNARADRGTTISVCLPKQPSSNV